MWVFNISDLCDISLVTIVIYNVLLWLRRSKSTIIFMSAAFFGATYLLSRQMEMELTVKLFNVFFPVLLMGGIVIFHEDIRSMLEQMVYWLSKKKSANKSNLSGQHGRVYEIITRTVFRLAEKKIGALIVLPMGQYINRFITGGQKLNGEVSESILMSIFDPHSPGHDGAVIISGDRILSYGCHLPLSSSHELLKGRGTRHAAALGLAEKTQALVIVISEERGEVSYAHESDLSRVERADVLLQILNQSLSRRELGLVNRRNLWQIIMAQLPEKILAVSFSFALWLVLVFGGEMVYHSYQVPVKLKSINFTEKDAIRPKAVELTFTGLRRTFYFLDPKSIQIVLNPDQATESVNEKILTISQSDISIPNGMVLRSIHPREISVKK